MEQPPSEMLTVQQVAERLNCSRSQVYTLLQGGEIEYIALGRRGKRVERAELERYIDAHRRRGSEPWHSEMRDLQASERSFSRKRATVEDLKERIRAQQK